MKTWNENNGGKIIEGMHRITSDPEDYKGKLVFAPVRNPYSRALSIWKHIKWLSKYDSRIEIMLEEFLGRRDMRVKDVFRYSQIGFIKKFDFPFDEVEVHYVRMENLEDEMKALGIPFGITYKEGSSNTDSWGEVDNLTDRAIGLIEEWAEEDFEVLNYGKL